VRARELAADYPAVTLDTSALEAARLLSERRLPGLIVIDDQERPCAVLPGSQILRFAVPRYVQDDPALARVYDEEHADRLGARLSGRRVRDVLPDQPATAPVVDAEATVMEIAAVMAAAHSPLVAVVDAPQGTNGPLLGAITVAQLLARLLPPD
jgi:CBS domain-containing protein